MKHDIYVNSSIISTTILAVKHRDSTAMAGDGQVSHNGLIIKNTVNKIRYIYSDKILAGFAGTTCDALYIFKQLEQKLMHYPNLSKACAELMAEKLNCNAYLLVADSERIVLITGAGDLLESDDGILAIGSGAGYAMAAARALKHNTKLSAKTIAHKSLLIASDLCLHTNQCISTLVIG